MLRSTTISHLLTVTPSLDKIGSNQPTASLPSLFYFFISKESKPQIHEPEPNEHSGQKPPFGNQIGKKLWQSFCPILITTERLCHFVHSPNQIIWSSCYPVVQGLRLEHLESPSIVRGAGRSNTLLCCHWERINTLSFSVVTGNRVGSLIWQDCSFWDY